MGNLNHFKGQGREICLEFSRVPGNFCALRRIFAVFRPLLFPLVFQTNEGLPDLFRLNPGENGISLRKERS